MFRALAVFCGLLACLIGTGAALAMINVKTALDVWWKIAGIFGGGILGIILLGRLTRASSGQAAIATAVGIVLIGGRTLFPDQILPFLHPLLTRSVPVPPAPPQSSATSW